MSDQSKFSPTVKPRWDIVREAVAVLKTRLHDTFKRHNLLELNTVDVKTATKICFWENNDISELAQDTKRRVVAEHGSETGNDELEIRLEAATHVFLIPYLEANKKNREIAIGEMTNTNKIFVKKYKRSLDRFLDITNVCILDESLLKSFHNVTTKLLLKKYDQVDKPGDDDFKAGYRKELEDSIDKIFLEILNSEVNKALAKTEKIETFILEQTDDHVVNLREEAKKLESEEQLEAVHQQLMGLAMKKFKKAVLATTSASSYEINLAELRFNDQFTISYHKILAEVVALIEKTKAEAINEYNNSTNNFKEKVQTFLKKEGNSHTRESISSHQKNIEDTVLDEFNSKMANTKYIVESKAWAEAGMKLEKNLLKCHQLFCNKWDAQEQEAKKKLCWVPHNNFKILELNQAGYCGPTILYVARAFHKGTWIPGQLAHHHNSLLFRTYIPADGLEHGYAEFEVLVVPPELTRWVKAQPKSIPQVAIPVDPNQKEPTYICRAFIDGNLHIGKVCRNSDNALIPGFGKEHRINTTFEVLVLKAHGVD